MFGVLNIYKPPGPTSRDVVNRVERLVRPQKAGHAGTLDPIASGVLLVCVGQATRLIEYAQALAKSYRGTFLLGRRSDSDDVEGAVEVVADAIVPTRAEVDAALAPFRGEVMQRPPRHSAVKIAGQRAYALARRGVDFEPEAKAVVIHRLEVARYDYPELVLDVECGSGTYIRSLGRDLAEALGTSAVMAALERVAVGPFTAEDALPFDHVAERWEERLERPSLLVASLPSVAVTGAELLELQHGRGISRALGCGDGGEIAALDGDQNLVALLRERSPGVLSSVRNFTQPA